MINMQSLSLVPIYAQPTIGSICALKTLTDKWWAIDGLLAAEWWTEAIYPTRPTSLLACLVEHVIMRTAFGALLGTYLPG
jgi:hypothetical protein